MLAVYVLFINMVIKEAEFFHQRWKTETPNLSKYIMLYTQILEKRHAWYITTCWTFIYSLVVYSIYNWISKSSFIVNRSGSRYFFLYFLHFKIDVVCVCERVLVNEKLDIVNGSLLRVNHVPTYVENVL